MKVIIPRYKIENLINYANSVVDQSSTSIIFSNIIIEAIDKKIFIYASDSQITFKGFEEAEVIEEGRMIINSKRFYNTIKVMPDTDIIIAKDQEENILINPAGDNPNPQFKLKGIIEGDYRITLDESELSFFEYDFNLLKEMISLVIFSIGVEDRFFKLDGALIEKKGEKINFVTTDKKRLSYTYQFEDSPDLKVFVPKKFLNEILKIKTVEEKALLHIDEGRIGIKIDNITIVSKLLELKFPEHKSVIPDKIQYEAIIDPKEFLTKLKTVSVMFDSLESGVILNFEMDKLFITNKDKSQGEAIDQLEIEYRQDPINLTVSYENLNDYLKTIKYEKIKFGYNPDRSQIILKPDTENENFKYLYIAVTLD